MPIEPVCQLFEDLYGYDLNSSTVLDVLERGHERSAWLEETTKSRLLEEKVVHFDETGLRVVGKLYWLPTASTPNDTPLFVHEKRGQEALKSAPSVLKDFTGMAVHDCWASYFTFAKARHALCGAHLLRELDGVRATNASLWAEEMHKFLLNLYQRPRPVAAPEAVREHYQSILEAADQEEPLPCQGWRGKPKRSPGRNLLERLRIHQDGVLAFALEAGVPFTNNQAERDLRGIKVKLKVSGSFRTLEGARIHARLQAVISTVRKRGEKVFARLRELFSPPLALAVTEKGE